jgi:hypothetical protein
MLERRRLPRTRILAPAKVIPGWSLGCGCVVRNITSLGALLEFRSVAVLPIVFELTFDSARTLQFCKIAWRTRTKIGVEFCARNVLDDRPLPSRRNARYRAAAQKKAPAKFPASLGLHRRESCFMGASTIEWQTRVDDTTFRLGLAAYSWSVSSWRTIRRSRS